jgi:hypothetical protein
VQGPPAPVQGHGPGGGGPFGVLDNLRCSFCGGTGLRLVAGPGAVPRDPLSARLV